MEVLTVEDFPDEVLLDIFSRLPVSDVVTCARVCKRWNSLLRDPQLWRGKEYHRVDWDGDGEALEVVRLNPHLKKLFVGISLIPKIWLSGCNIYISSYSLRLETFERLITTCHVESLSVPACILRHRGFASLITKLTNLKSLTVTRDVTRPSPETVPLSADTWHDLLGRGSFPRLRELYAFRARFLDDETVLALCATSPHLEVLTVQDSLMLTERGLHNLSACPELKVLDLTRCESVRNLSFLRHCPQLRVLDLSLCEQLKSAVFRHVLHLRRLECLRVRSCDLAGLPVGEMAERLQCLREVDYFYSRNVGESLPQFFRRSASTLPYDT